MSYFAHLQFQLIRKGPTFTSYFEAGPFLFLSADIALCTHQCSYSKQLDTTRGQTVYRVPNLRERPNERLSRFRGGHRVAFCSLVPTLCTNKDHRFLIDRVGNIERLTAYHIECHAAASCIKGYKDYEGYIGVLTTTTPSGPYYSHVRISRSQFLRLGVTTTFAFC